MGVDVLSDGSWGPLMIIGKGMLSLRSAARIPVEYQFGSDYDDSRAGYLLCDTKSIDPGALGERLKLTCEDGSEVVIAVTNMSDRYLGVIGRVQHQERGDGPQRGYP